MPGTSGTARVDGRSQDGPGLDRRRGGGHEHGRLRGGDRGAETEGFDSTAGGGRGVLLSSVLCMTTLAHLKGQTGPPVANRDQLGQAQANYARIRGDRRTVGGAEWTAMGSVVYLCIYIIYISLRAAFVPLAPRYNNYGPIVP